MAGVAEPADAFLVGLRVPEANEELHPVCVEPENGVWNPALFAGCWARAEEIYAAHPGHQIFYGDEPSMRDKPENLRRSSARSAVMEPLETYDLENGVVSFCGSAYRVGSYYVVPVVQLSRATVERAPRLPDRLELDRLSAPVGFLESTIESVLREATAGLSGPEPGRSLRPFRVDPQSLLRDAGDDFCSNITLFTGDVMLQEVFAAVNVISSLLYEGATTRGEIAFVRRPWTTGELQIELRQPVPLARHRLARKLVEMTGGVLSCVCFDGAGIAGLGQVEGTDCLRVRFTGHYRWDLLCGDVVLMQSAFGVSRLPATRLSKDKFLLLARRVLNSARNADLEVLWSIVDAAVEQKHGTMLVFSEDAASEATRLSHQGLVVQSTPLKSDLVHKVTAIDGAVLVDAVGKCHAIGVILDGIATATGDAARGARFNSAVRYLGNRPRTMCVVVSEDGQVDLLPRLPAQVKRSEIHDHLRKLQTADTWSSGKLIHWLSDHRFYLSREECDLINRELDRLEAEPAEVGEIRLITTRFSPHPGMNDSFYLPEV